MILPVKMQLYTKILIGMIAGVVAGMLLGPRSAFLEPFGTAFIRLISMLIVPLVFASLVVGVASLGNVKKLGRIGLKTLAYFVIATVFAILIGLTLAATLKPGAGISDQVREEIMRSYSSTAAERLQTVRTKLSASEILLDLIPPNPVRAAAEGHLLQIIFFAVLFGIVTASLEEKKSKVLVDFFSAINDVMIKLVAWVLKLAPYGVFALIAGIIGKFGLGILINLLKFSLLVLIGLAAHLAIFYTVSVKVLARQSLRAFYRAIRPAQLIAFGTTSSAAALPVSMQCSQENIKISRQVTSFVVPLGASLSHDGSAIYQVTSAVFIAQVYSQHLGIEDYLLILLLGTLLGFGTAAVPAASLINITVILKSFGIPLEGIALVLGVDRILDMCRTALNVTGQLAAATFVAASEGEKLFGAAVEASESLPGPVK
jgi:Na+/H+-dicarboxylate symporter